MRKSILNIAKPLNNQLLKIHDIANLLTKKDNKGLTDFENWLFETEELLKKNNQPQTARLSVIRTQLVNFIPKNKSTKRKEVHYNASNLLTEAQETLWNTNMLNNQKIETAKDLVNQLLVIVYQTKVFKFDDNQNFTHFLESIWGFCNTHEQLKNFTNQIISQVNKADVLQIIAEEIDLKELL